MFPNFLVEEPPEVRAHLWRLATWVVSHMGSLIVCLCVLALTGKLSFKLNFSKMV
jgi:hypothetical protein